MKTIFRCNLSTTGFRVEATGGDYGGGILRGVSLASRGEARGHGMWADLAFVGQVVDSVNDAPAGLPSLVDHSDRVGDLLGRIRTGRLSSNREQALADLHLFASAPARDLILEVANNAPETLGLSLSFELGVSVPAEQGNDPLNVKKLAHARIAKVWSADVVVYPALNPTGLFRSGAVVSGARPTAQQPAPVVSRTEARAQRLAAAMQAGHNEYEAVLSELYELAGNEAAFALIAQRAVQLEPAYAGRNSIDMAVKALTAHARRAHEASEKESRLAARRSGKCW
jgi:hypothetical protein